jgi:hypothetical protein
MTLYDGITCQNCRLPGNDDDPLVPVTSIDGLPPRDDYRVHRSHTADPESACFGRDATALAIPVRRGVVNRLRYFFRSRTRARVADLEELLDFLAEDFDAAMRRLEQSIKELRSDVGDDLGVLRADMNAGDGAS